MSRYASVIIDIALEKLDHPFSYRIPEEIDAVLEEGMEVTIPFGRADTPRKGYVVAIDESCSLSEDQLKDITCINERSVSLAAKTMALAIWMMRTYGGTLINAMRTVLPVK